MSSKAIAGRDPYAANRYPSADSAIPLARSGGKRNTRPFPLPSVYARRTYPSEPTMTRYSSDAPNAGVEYATPD